jgi:hypothetical protein
MRKLFAKLLIAIMIMLGTASVTFNGSNVGEEKSVAVEDTVQPYVVDPGGGRT